MVCNKHPRHEQSPGVCSVCLGEKLSQLSASSSSDNANKENIISSGLTSFSSSCYSSSEGSPVHHKYHMSGVLRVARKDKFRKSKSVAAVEREREARNKKRGFWSKLLRLRTKKIEAGLVHSSTIATRVH